MKNGREYWMLHYLIQPAGLQAEKAIGNQLGLPTLTNGF